jgi:hypothetical protein
MGTTVLAVLAFGVGAGMVVATLLSAIMTLVVPRALPVMITRWVFTGIRTLFRLRGGGPGAWRRATGTWPCTGRSTCSALPRPR